MALNYVLDDFLSSACEHSRLEGEAFSAKSRTWGWYHPCLSRRVDQTPVELVYDEPTVLWRMRRSGGLQSYAVIGPRPQGAVVVWFINGRPLGFRDFSDWTSALLWSDRMQAQNWAVGWRLASD